MACTMLIHVAMQSPEGVIRAYMWPVAMNYTVCLYIIHPRERQCYPRMTCGPDPSFISQGILWKDIMYGCSQNIYWKQDSRRQV